MTDIMIDMTSRPSKRYLVNRCHYPEGKIIDPTTDHDARKTDKGDWILWNVCY
ncbi:MAG: hypothetical protein WB815_10610 [Nitrososphaeraceae archaeon]